MRQYTRPVSSLLTAVALGIATMLASCGGGDGGTTPIPDDPSISVPTEISIAYGQGDLSEKDPGLQKMTASLATTSGALLQAIFAVNSFAFTDTKVTDYATYLQRQADADRALNILILYAEETERNANALPISETGLQPARRGALPQSVALPMNSASPEEVLAVLNSSNSSRPIKTLMQQYQVSAKKAQLILNNAMAGLTSQAYLEHLNP